MRLSASRLRTWLACRLAYQRKYVQGLPDISGPAAEVGQCVHGGLQRAWDFLKDGYNGGDGGFHRLADEGFRLLWSGLGHPPVGKLYADGLAMVVNHVGMWKEFPEAERILGVERSLEVQIDADTSVLGIFDLILDDSPKPSGREHPEMVSAVAVHDWKTGWVVMSQGELGEDVQAAVYAMMAADAYPNAIVTTVWHYVRHGVQVVRTWSTDELVRMREWVGQVGKAIASATEYPATVGAGCAYCAYSSTCDAVKASGLSSDLDTHSPVGLITAMEECKAREKYWRVQKETLSDEVSRLLDHGPVSAIGKTWSMGTTTRRSMDASKILPLATALEVDRSVFDEAISVQVTVLDAVIRTLPIDKQARAKELASSMMDESVSSRIMSRVEK